MLLTVALTLMALVAIALLTIRPPSHDWPADDRTAPRYKPGTRVRAGQLVRVIHAREAVRGDDGYVRVYQN